MTGPYDELCEAYFRYKETDDETLSWAWDKVDAEGFHDPIEKGDAWNSPYPRS